MLNIFATNSYKNGARYIIGQLQKVNKRDLEHSHILLVPDRASMSAEQLVLDNVGGSFNIQVLTFRRYANSLTNYANYLKKQSAIMALSAIVLHNKDNLKCFCRGVESLGFVEGVYEIICQLKYARISPNDICPQSYPIAISSKMEDVKLLYSAYESYLEGGFIDSAQKLEGLISEVASHPAVRNSYFYLMDFETLSAQEAEIVAQLVGYSKGVSVACLYSDKAHHKHLYSNDVYNTLLATAKKHNIEPYIQTHYSYDNEMQRAIGEKLFAYGNATPTNVEQGRVKVNILGGVAQEVTALAQDISAHVMSGGRYGDYYVVCSDVNKYKMAVDRIFADHNIPYFTDTKQTLAQHPAGQFIIDYLNARRNNFRRENVIPVTKNYFFSHGEEVFEFENYCLKYNASYDFERFTLGKDDESIDFALADRVRERFFDLCNNYPFLPSDSAKNYANTVDGLVREVIEGQIEEFCACLDDGRQKKASEQVCEKLHLLLGEYALTMGECTVKLEEFCKVLTVGMQSVTLSVLPVTGDSVVLTNMGKSRKHDIRVLALLGANSGNMPIVKKDTKLLTDANIRTLGENGIILDCLIADENRRETLNVHQLLHEAERLFVCASDRHGEGELGTIRTPSDFVYRLAEIFCVSDKGIAITTTVKEDMIYTAKLGIVSAVNHYRKMADGGKITSPRLNIVNKYFGRSVQQYCYDVIAQEYINSDVLTRAQETTVSKTECFYSCPQKHYFRYGLNIKPRLDAKLNSSDLGDILHDALERFIKGLKRQHTAQQAGQLAMACFAKSIEKDYYQGICKDISARLTLANLQKECVAVALRIHEQLANSDFSFVGAEVEFGRGKSLPALVVGDTQLRGKIDRVDKCGEQFLCVDYKSGNYGTDYSESALYVGAKLQLPLYVTAVRRATKWKNVGFYYFKLHDNFIEAGKKRYHYIGRSVNDVDVLCKIDNSLKGGTSELLGIALKKDGSVRKTSAVADRQCFDAQPYYAQLLLARAYALYKKGYVKPSPYVKDSHCSCDYCDYKTLCFAQDLYPDCCREEVKGVTAEDVKNIVAQYVKSVTGRAEEAKG